MRKKTFFLLIYSLAALGCATTEIGSVVDHQQKLNAYTSVLFISTMSNLIQKQQIEESFFKATSDLDVKAYISMKVLPPTRDYMITEIEDVLDQYKIDGILIIALQDYWETNTYIPGGSETQGSASLIGNTLRYSAVTVNTPGTMISQPNAIFDCRLFDSRKQAFVWRSTSRTSGDMFSDFSTMASSLSFVTLNRLVQDSIFRIKQKGLTPSLFTESQAAAAISAAESLYILGNKGTAISKLAVIEPKISNSSLIAKKGKLLARISFLRGTYFFQQNDDVAAMNNWRAAYTHDPEFAPQGIVGKEIEYKYRDFIESIAKEEIKTKEVQRLESVTLRRSNLIQIIKDGAVLRLEPSNESLVIRPLPLGGLLTVEGVENDWIKIILPADKDGIPIVGYLHISFVKKASK